MGHLLLPAGKSPLELGAPSELRGAGSSCSNRRPGDLQYTQHEKGAGPSPPPARSQQPGSAPPRFTTFHRPNVRGPCYHLHGGHARAPHAGLVGPRGVGRGGAGRGLSSLSPLPPTPSAERAPASRAAGIG